MKKPVFTGTVQEGKLIFDDRTKFDLYVGTLEGRVEIQVKPLKSSRSQSQREYYWAVIVPALAAPLGLDDPEQVNQWLKDHFNAKTVTVFNNQEKLGMSIEAEPTDKVEDIYRQIREWASTVGVFIPEPKEDPDWLKKEATR